MNSDYRSVGCVGNDCPHKDNCARYLEVDTRSIVFQTPPYNMYPQGDEEVAICGYKEYPKVEKA